jgi:hypothetical protein
MSPLMISCKPLQVPNCDRIILFPHDAYTLALAFLWTHPSAYGREAVHFPNMPNGSSEFPFPYELNKSGNIDSYRATFYAGGFFALKASLGLFHCELRSISQRDF